jgi:peptidoglycan/LPS O-acetylase OafA/YrhL
MGGVQQPTRNGMDLFSAFSGLVIHGILLGSKGSMNYFRNFYVRRALGIWPLVCHVLEIFLSGLPSTPKGGWKTVPRKYLKSKSEFAALAAWHEFSIRLSGETP